MKPKTQPRDTFELFQAHFDQMLDSRHELVILADKIDWASLWVRRNGKSRLRRYLRSWPVRRPRNWLTEVNRAMDDGALEPVRKSLTRGVPLGDEAWRGRVVMRLGLDITLRPPGRPRKNTQKSS